MHCINCGKEIPEGSNSILCDECRVSYNGDNSNGDSNIVRRKRDIKRAAIRKAREEEGYVAPEPVHLEPTMDLGGIVMHSFNSLEGSEDTTNKKEDKKNKSKKLVSSKTKDKEKVKAEKTKAKVVKEEVKPQVEEPIIKIENEVENIVEEKVETKVVETKEPKKKATEKVKKEKAVKVKEAKVTTKAKTKTTKADTEVVAQEVSKVEEAKKEVEEVKEETKKVATKKETKKVEKEDKKESTIGLVGLLKNKVTKDKVEEKDTKNTKATKEAKTKVAKASKADNKTKASASVRKTNESDERFEGLVQKVAPIPQEDRVLNSKIELEKRRLAQEEKKLEAIKQARLRREEEERKEKERKALEKQREKERIEAQKQKEIERQQALIAKEEERKRKIAEAAQREKEKQEQREAERLRKEKEIEEELRAKEQLRLQRQKEAQEKIKRLEEERIQRQKEREIEKENKRKEAEEQAKILAEQKAIEEKQKAEAQAIKDKEKQKADKVKAREKAKKAKEREEKLAAFKDKVKNFELPFVLKADHKLDEKDEKATKGKKTEVKKSSVKGKEAKVTTKAKTNAAPKAKAKANAKKKKRNQTIGIVLKAGVLVLALIPLYKLTKTQCNKKANDIVSKFVIEHPIKFGNDTDTVNYITSDFDLPVTFTVDGQDYNVIWTTNDDSVQIDKEGHAKVVAPEGDNRKVTLNLEYKYKIGKATLPYDCTIVSGTVKEVTDYNVVNKDEVINGTYDGKMELDMNPNGSVRSMYGDFKETKVNNTNDAIVLINAYKANLGIDSRFEFKVDSMNSTDKFMIYNLEAYYNGAKVQNNTVQLTVNKDTFNLVKITNNCYVVIDQIEAKIINQDLNYGQIIADYMSNQDKRFIYREDCETIHEGRYCNRYSLYLRDGGFYTMFIAKSNGEVVYFEEEGTEATCSGKDEFGNEVTFEAKKADADNFYYLHDTTRGIHEFDNVRFWDVYKDEHIKNDKTTIPSVIKVLNENKINAEISSIASVFENSVHVETFKNMQNVYDFYYNTLNRYSYDNRGGEVVILADSNMTRDNACWVADWKTFQVNPAEKFKYSVSSSPEVIAHEFTHAVFGSFATGYGKELAGINEGYSDVLGVLAIGKNNWKLGQNAYSDTGATFYIRDLQNYNGEDLYGKFCEKYDDEVWNSSNQEEHATCLLLGHIGYAMHESELFTDEEVAKIWYESLAFGYDSSSTFFDARTNIIQAARELNCTDDQLRFIMVEFDKENIFDKGTMHRVGM